jgi:hypothetical protein
VLVLERVEGRKLLTWVNRLHVADGEVVTWRSYYFCPDLIEAVAERLGMEPLTHGYQYVGGGD